MRRVGVVGLGRIGLPTAVALSTAGFEVVGVDTDAERVSALRRGDLPWAEPGLSRDLIAPIALHASFDFDAAALDAWIIAVGTTSSDGTVDVSAVWAAAATIAASSRPSSLLIVESTVEVGTCDAIARRWETLLVASCPERAAPGAIMRELQSSPRLVGGVSAAATERAQQIYDQLGCPTIACTAREAELTKLAENAFRAVNVAFANELAGVARSFGVDPFHLMELANSHPRVDILRPGLGAGGSCLPMARTWFARKTPGGLCDAAERAEHRVASDVVGRLAAVAPEARRVVVVGTAYKPDAEAGSDVDPATPVRPLIDALERCEYAVSTWDFGGAGALDVVLAAHDAVIFGCAHTCFRRLEPPPGGGRALIDPVGAVDLDTWSRAGWTTSR